LLGRWTHSFEEDHDGVTVYRRTDFAFPPARGRRGVEFRPDGTFVDWLIGRGDAPEASTGRWDQTGVISRASGPPGTVVQAGSDRLEISWQE
jgi:hypothetical protein